MKDFLELLKAFICFAVGVVVFYALCGFGCAISLSIFGAFVVTTLLLLAVVMNK